MIKSYIIVYGMMTRAMDSIFQASMVMAVIVMSPYAMFATRGCAGEQRAGGGGAQEDVARPADAPPRAAAEPAPQEPAAQQVDACVVPRIAIPRSAGCENAEPYPSCRWKVPDPGPGSAFVIWRNTRSANRWARPALVSLVLAAARQYASLHPDEPLTLGDLDAPGDRHKTHARGVDADLYLPGRMATENEGKSRWVDNYANRSSSYVEKSRARVLDLARILATCAGGRIRIFYNDPPVVEAFLAWFGAQGLETPFDAAMAPHNELHLFHFHVTIPADLEVLPFEQAGEP